MHFRLLYRKDLKKNVQTPCNFNGPMQMELHIKTFWLYLDLPANKDLKTAVISRKNICILRSRHRIKAWMRIEPIDLLFTRPPTSNIKAEYTARQNQNYSTWGFNTCWLGVFFWPIRELNPLSQNCYCHSRGNFFQIILENLLMTVQTVKDGLCVRLQSCPDLICSFIH